MTEKNPIELITRNASTHYVQLDSATTCCLYVIKKLKNTIGTAYALSNVKRTFISLSTIITKENKMGSLISTALIMAGIFVVCYPVVVYLLNKIMTNIENESGSTKTPA